MVSCDLGFSSVLVQFGAFGEIDGAGGLDLRMFGDFLDIWKVDPNGPRTIERSFEPLGAVLMSFRYSRGQLGTV